MSGERNPEQPESIDDLVAEYKAWRDHWDADRPLADEYDPYRCPVCDAQMMRNPWRCKTHGEQAPAYKPEPYHSRLAAHLAEEEREWDSDRDWLDLLDALIAEREETSS